MPCIGRRKCVNIIIAVVAVELFYVILSNFNLPRLPFGDVLGLEEDHGYHDDEPVESFLFIFHDYCQRLLFPREPNGSAMFTSDYNSSLCPCVPQGLVGRFTEEKTTLLRPLQPGGVSVPGSCLARQQVAVIIPFRDRAEHLRILLSVLHPMLQRQQLHYTIFVVEQGEPEVFNKAALMNAGFLEARARSHFDCYIFHDVDMIPEDDRNFYVCSETPRHVGSHLADYNYRVIYDKVFGGVTAFTEEQFVKVNGFSNGYYGWGGEDDDMRKRVKAQGYMVTRFPREVARYHMVQHGGDLRNPYNIKSNLGYRLRPDHYKKDGVNSVKYQRVGVELRPSYTWLLIALPQHPSNSKFYSRYSSARSVTYSSYLLLFTVFVSAVCFLHY